MADYLRRLVSGNKARFKDEDLKLELGVCDVIHCYFQRVV